MKSYISTLPLISADSNLPLSAILNIAEISFLSSPPFFVKNFSPLRLKGKWLAVIIIPAVVGRFLSTVAINIAGVEAMPQSNTFAPLSMNPSTSDAFNAGPDILESVPTAMLGLSVPVSSCNHFTNDCANILTTSGVRLTSSPITPSIAIPRMSEPF